MNLPFVLPAWLPWWAPVAVLVPVLLYAFAFLLMPFSVLGVKGRIEAVDARLDEIQAEIRALVLRLPEAAARYEEDYAPGAPPARTGGLAPRPPIPPRREPDRDLSDSEPAPRPDMRPRSPPAADSREWRARTEPRVDWPGRSRD